MLFRSSRYAFDKYPIQQTDDEKGSLLELTSSKRKLHELRGGIEGEGGNDSAVGNM